LIEADWNLNARVFVREVRLQGQRLGTGAGVELAVDRTIWRAEPQWVIGYRGSWATFSTTATDARLVGPAVAVDVPPPVRRAILNNLVAPRINRHGVGMFFTDNLANAWSYRFALGADYDFELDSLGYNVALGFNFRPRKSIELGAEGGYTSSANASNAGSEAFLLNLLLRFYY
jgi:hypothetical protein